MTNCRPSRIIVKNLPIYAAEDRLKKHFSQKGQVTDVRLMRKKDGKSRRFGFIGYKTDQEAEEAVKFFHQTFLDTAKLDVQLAKTIDDDSLLRKKRRRNSLEQESSSKKTKGGKPEAQQTKKGGSEEPESENPMLKEFLTVMDHHGATKSWANDDMTVSREGQQVVEEGAKVLVEEDGDSEYDELPTKKDVPEDGDDEPMVSLSSMGEQEDDGLARDENVSDMEWLRKRSARIVDGNDAPSSGQASENVDSAQDTDQTALESEQTKSDHELAVEKILESRRLFLRNLLYSCTEDDLRELFEQFGSVEEVHLAVSPKTGKSKGFAYVMFDNGQDAVSAFESLDGKSFQGRLLHIIPAERKKENRLDEFDLKNLPLKKQRELQRKAAASKAQFSWNSLYLNSDAVMEAVAKRLGVQKSELLDPNSSDAGVKAALAETYVLNNVKSYFESKGVDLTKFSTKEKSDVVILVKNLPFDTTLEEISEMFAVYGELESVLMPPDGGIAMVVFKTAPEARAAFTKLAYRRIKNSILYLEKGPKDVFKTAPPPPEAGTTAANAKDARPAAEEILAAEDDADEGDVPDVHVSVFVKNLNFKTTSRDLHNAFSSLDGFVVATVKVKPDPKNPGQTQSMGFGFVEFKTKRHADVASKAIDGYVLDGHKLQAKISHRGQADDTHPLNKTDSLKSKAKGSKILVKNVPFEATKNDIRQLLGNFGQLRSVRVPKKFNKSARGFAFAEFVSAKEAENALKSLEGTHLLGRRLVFQYAQDDSEDAEEEIRRMEAKVRKQVNTETMAAMRLTGKRKDIDMEEA